MNFINPVRIKAVFQSCSQDEFIKYARFIRRKTYTTEPGTNLHAMYVNLYIWCRAKYRQRFLTPQPPKRHKWWLREDEWDLYLGIIFLA